jgi:hypothetical protein
MRVGVHIDGSGVHALHAVGLLYTPAAATGAAAAAATAVITYAEKLRRAGTVAHSSASFGELRLRKRMGL